MSIKTVNFTTNTTKELVRLGKSQRSHGGYLGTFSPHGTWGGGSMTYQYSPDGGTTKIDMKDLTNTLVTSTANDLFTVGPLGNFGFKGSAEEGVIYGTLTGSTNANIDVDIQDNLGD